MTGKVSYNQEPLEQSIREFEEVLMRASARNVYKIILATVEKPLIEGVLERTFGNKIKAAKILGLNRNTLHSKIKKLAIDINKFKEYP
ncbi:MAG: Fis family transcriptional regulator [Omnitrophica bacterium]|nr:Fis family transcriptional regulator [Candidatus Omnitrophota bacterium]